MEIHFHFGIPTMPFIPMLHVTWLVRVEFEMAKVGVVERRSFSILGKSMWECTARVVASTERGRRDGVELT